MQKMVYEDYKYVMQDTNNLYVGGKYSLNEIIENEEIPFKFRVVVERYLYTEQNQDAALESIFYYLEKKGMEYKVLKQLKTKVRISIIESKKSLLSKEIKQEYVTKTVTIEEFADMPFTQKEKNGVIVQEIIMSKLALMTF